MLADGTKCYSQNEDRSYHHVQATRGDAGDGSTTLLDATVNGDWNEIASSLSDVAAVTDDTTVVSDAENGIVKGRTAVCRDRQHDPVHSGRTVGYTLRDDGVLSPEERHPIVAEVTDELFHLKNSVEKHRPEGEDAAMHSNLAGPPLAPATSPRWPSWPSRPYPPEPSRTKDSTHDPPE